MSRCAHKRLSVLEGRVWIWVWVYLCVASSRKWGRWNGPGGGPPQVSHSQEASRWWSCTANLATAVWFAANGEASIVDSAAVVAAVVGRYGVCE